jgi:N-acetylmuramoyl-L-alanine amidase
VKIVIDPGHGGSTTIGGSSPNNAIGLGGAFEKDVVFDIGQRLAKVLRIRHNTAMLTLSTDTNLGLRDRALLADEE